MWLEVSTACLNFGAERLVRVRAMSGCCIPLFFRVDSTNCGQHDTWCIEMSVCQIRNEFSIQCTLLQDFTRCNYGNCWKRSTWLREGRMWINQTFCCRILRQYVQHMAGGFRHPFRRVWLNSVHRKPATPRWTRHRRSDVPFDSLLWQTAATV